MSDELTGLAADALEARINEIRTRMRPLESELAELRAQRDVLLTEVRRRERLETRTRRAGARAAAKAGEVPTLAEIVAAGEPGSLEDRVYNLRTGGEVRLGFPGARAQAVSLTDGRQVVHAQDLAQAASLYAAGWEIGSPGRPGVRVHFPGSRQERLVDPGDVFATPRSESAEPRQT